jgi:hypothetical protein
MKEPNMKQIANFLVLQTAPILALALIIFPMPARALTFNINFDSTVMSQPNAAQIEAAYGVVTQAYSSLFTNPITVNITVSVESSGFGNSGLGLGGNPSYDQVVMALADGATTFYASNAIASLPPDDPTPSQTWWIPSVEIKALTDMTAIFGADPDDTNSDGQFSFTTNDVTWAFSATNRAVPGEFDFIAVAEHETSEIMGRCSGLGNISGGYVPFDLFRFTNGVQDLNGFDPGTYFSVDNGVTPLRYYNSQPGGDPQDWAPTNNPDPYDYVLGTGVEARLSATDLTVMDILGYNLNFQPPKVATTRLANGDFELTFTNVTGLNFQVLASTNLQTPLANWVNLGFPTEIPINHYQFTDTNAVNKARFYRVILQ